MPKRRICEGSWPSNFSPRLRFPSRDNLAEQIGARRISDERKDERKFDKRRRAGADNMKWPHVQIDPARPLGPAPEIRETQRYVSAARFSTIGLFVLGLLFALHEASALVAPMAAALVFGVVLSRIGDRAQALGVPPFLAATAFVLATGAGIVLAASALTSRISSLIDRAPEIASRFSGAIASWTRPLQALKAQIFGATAQPGVAAPSLDIGAVTGVLGGLTPALGGALIFLATLFFFVAGRDDLRRKIVFAYDDRERRLSALRILNGVEEALAHYFGSAALIYGALAFLTALLAWATGLGAPLLWGVFVFVACFVPFLGVAIVSAALLAAGLTSHDGLLAGSAPAVAYFIAHLALENAALPAIVGKRFEINPFLVFISIVFWTWMWGAIGAVIASPLLLIFKIVQDELRDAEKTPKLPT